MSARLLVARTHGTAVGRVQATGGRACWRGATQYGSGERWSGCAAANEREGSGGGGGGAETRRGERTAGH